MGDAVRATKTRGYGRRPQITKGGVFPRLRRLHSEMSSEELHGSVQLRTALEASVHPNSYGKGNGRVVLRFGNIGPSR